MAWDQSRIDAAARTASIASEKAAKFAESAMADRDFGLWNEMSNAGLVYCQEEAAYWASMALETRCNLVNQRHSQPNDEGVTPASLIAWRQRLHLTVVAAAKALGCSRRAIQSWEAGRTRIPLYVELACHAVERAMAD